FGSGASYGYGSDEPPRHRTGQGKLSHLRHFSREDAPISLGVIFDMSGSMSSKIERACEAVTEFLKTANPQDEFFLIAFADKPQEISDFTQSWRICKENFYTQFPRAALRCWMQSI